jgi:hypothetical protein
MKSRATAKGLGGEVGDSLSVQVASEPVSCEDRGERRFADPLVSLQDLYCARDMPRQKKDGANEGPAQKIQHVGVRTTRTLGAERHSISAACCFGFLSIIFVAADPFSMPLR